MPADDTSERAVIAGALFNPRLMPDIAETLAPDAMYSAFNRRVYSAMLDLFAASEPVDHLTVAHKLASKNTDGDANHILKRLADLAHGLPHVTNTGKLVENIQGKAKLRAVITACAEITQLAASSADADKVVEQLQEAAFKLAITGSYATNPTRIDELFNDAITIAEQRMAEPAAFAEKDVKTSLADLDAITGGWKKGDLIIIAGRPSLGKTAYALQAAHQGIVGTDKIGIIYSLEMPKDQLTHRLIAREADIPMTALRTAGVLPFQLEQAKNTWGRFKDTGLFIHTPPRLTPMQMLSSAKKLAAKHGRLDLIVVDYLQLMHASDPSLKRSYDVVGSVSRDLKSIALELNVPVIALSQLSRAPEGRNPPRPMMSDLRESGSIEQDADIVILMYREDYYQRTESSTGIAELIIAKHRNGATGTVKALFDRATGKFDSVAKEWEERSQ